MLSSPVQHPAIPAPATPVQLLCCELLPLGFPCPPMPPGRPLTGPLTLTLPAVYSAVSRKVGKWEMNGWSHVLQPGLSPPSTPAMLPKPTEGCRGNHQHARLHGTSPSSGDCPCSQRCRPGRKGADSAKSRVQVLGGPAPTVAPARSAVLNLFSFKVPLSILPLNLDLAQ